MSETIIKKRCVLAIGGYEPAPPQRQCQRFVRELARFETTWNARATVTEPELSEDGSVASWQITTAGPNWQVETDYLLLRWDDFVAADFARSDWKRLPAGIAAFADFIVSGTLGRYFATNWRYALFFLYPVLLLLGFVAIGAVAGWLVMPFVKNGGLFVAALVMAAIFRGLYVIAKTGWRLGYIIDDWTFARDYARRLRPEVDARVERFAQALAARMADPSYDEIVVAGHSLGAPYSIDAVDRALKLAPGDMAGGPRLCLLSTGSSLLKVALHPAAGWLREAVARVSARPDIVWAEYQSMVDVINFYKTDPIAALHLPSTGRPSVQIVHMRDMLSEASYKRFRGDFFRIHRQFVMGNEKRYFYDYFSICCGPLRLGQRVRMPAGIVPAFAADGSLVAQAAATA